MMKKMKKTLLIIIILMQITGCASTNISTPVYVYQRDEIKYSDLVTLETKINKIFNIFYIEKFTQFDGEEISTFLGYKIDPLQLLHQRYPGYDSVIHPVVKKEEEVIIFGLYSKINITITARMANYISK